MADEFEKELTGLSLKLTAESEVALFWREKHGELLLMGNKYETELQSLRQEIRSSLFSLSSSNGSASTSMNAGRQEKAREEKERDIKTRITSLVLDRDAFREAYNEAMGEMRVKDELVQDLRGQVRGLKAWVSSSGKMAEQVADEAFGERWRMLGNGLQKFVCLFVFILFSKNHSSLLVVSFPRASIFRGFRKCGKLIFCLVGSLLDSERSRLVCSGLSLNSFLRRSPPLAQN